MAVFKFAEATPMNSEKTAKNIESSAHAMMRAIVDILTPRPGRPCVAGRESGKRCACISLLKGAVHKYTPTLNNLKSAKKLSIP